MPKVVFTDAAVRHLLADPKVRAWITARSGRAVPILAYFQRSYATSKDGIVTEYGDGFMLTFDDPDQDRGSRDLVETRLPVTAELDVLVVGPRPIFSNDFTVDWAKWKYSFEPHRLQGPDLRQA